jgi:acyl dehydratase
VSTGSTLQRRVVGGPWFEELEVGQAFEAPGFTLTDGHAAVHQAIAGDRMRLALDQQLAERVTGTAGALVHPALVWDVAIGQSTAVTGRVIANLFYRGLAFRRAPRVGDTLRTVTEVIALKQNRRRPDRPASGLALLRIRCRDQEEREVLDFARCAMLPLANAGLETGRADPIDASADVPADGRALDGWDLAAFRSACAGEHFADLEPGTTYEIATGDVVTAAPELVRLTLNLAAAHVDAGAGLEGRRLVYGGHTIGLAAGHLTRALPNLVYIVGWRGCDHLAPVFEGDTLRSTVTVERCADGLVDVRTVVSADRPPGATTPVLDWSLIAAMA